MNIYTITDFLGFTTKYTREPHPAITPIVTPEEPTGEKIVLISWQALARPQREWLTPKLFRTFIVMGILVFLLLTLMQAYFLMIAIISVLFVSYAFSTATPEQVIHEISNYGINYAGKFYYWSALTHFFFIESDISPMVAVDTKDMLPGRLFMAYNLKDRDTIKNALNKYLPLIDAEPTTIVDRLYKAAVNKLNINSTEQTRGTI